MSNEQKRSLGLLVVRLGVGAMFILVHGLPKLMGGPDRWAKVGSAMSHLGITFAPTFWGLAAALTEVFGGILLMMGLFTRQVSLALAGTMFVATMMHFGVGDTLLASSHSIEIGVVFLGLVFAGGGGYSLDARLRRRS